MQSQWRAGEKKDYRGRAWDCRAELALQRRGENFDSNFDLEGFMISIRLF